MVSDNDHIQDDAMSDDFSLESILAEYKGSAYINGEKKTPKDVLNEQAEKIIKEAAGDIQAKSPIVEENANTPRSSANPALGGHEQIEPDWSDLPKAESVLREPAVREPAFRVKNQETEREKVRVYNPKVRPADAREQLDDTRVLFDEKRQQPEVKWDNPDIPEIPAHKKENKNDKKENDVLFFDNFRHQETDDQDTIIRDVQKAIEKELGTTEVVIQEMIEEKPVPGKKNYGFYDELAEDDFEPEEPSLKVAASRFASECNSISLRCIPAAIITIFMVILTFSFEAGLMIPFGIGHSQAGTTGVLLIGLLVVMMLCVDIVVRGALSLKKGSPNAETLILFSCAFSFISAVAYMLGGASVILPYCAVSALTLTFAAFGEKFNLRAITDTLKTASGSSDPYGVHAEYTEDIDKSVLKKVYNRTDGFYNNLMHPDISELVYKFAAPALIAASLILSLITLLIRGGGLNFLHSLSATLAAAAPFSLLLTFSIPFGTVAKSIRRSGAAIAGWGGADDVCFSDGASITDEDIFPPGTMNLSGMKLFDGESPEKAIRYTASLIATSGSGLSGLFEEVLKTQGMNTVRVEDFACYEGGISALIRGERVATGNGAFMNLIGIRVPDDTNIKSAIYTAVNNRLVAMFTVEYMPINSVQAALISILKWRVKLFFAVRDFNITPLMLEQKFRVALEGIEYIQAKDSYTISDQNSGKQGRMAAVLTREGLGPFAEAITAGRLLKSSAFVATMVSVVSAAIGVLIMFFMFWSGAEVSARPGNLMLFMFSMLAAVLVVCGYVRCKK